MVDTTRSAADMRQPSRIPSTHARADEALSVLVVEDDNDTRAMYRSGLESAGMHVLEATGVDDALTVLGAAHPQVVVADLMLAGASGADLCRAIRAEPALRATGVVVVTGLSGESARGMLSGVAPDAVLIKPVDLGQFAATCASVGNHPRLR